MNKSSFRAEGQKHTEWQRFEKPVKLRDKRMVLKLGGLTATHLSLSYMAARLLDIEKLRIFGAHLMLRLKKLFFDFKIILAKLIFMTGSNTGRLQRGSEFMS